MWWQTGLFYLHGCSKRQDTEAGRPTAGGGPSLAEISLSLASRRTGRSRREAEPRSLPAQRSLWLVVEGQPECSQARALPHRAAPIFWRATGAWGPTRPVVHMGVFTCPAVPGACGWEGSVAICSLALDGAAGLLHTTEGLRLGVGKLTS